MYRTSFCYAIFTRGTSVRPQHISSEGRLRRPRRRTQTPRRLTWRWRRRLCGRFREGRLRRGMAAALITLPLPALLLSERVEHTIVRRARHAHMRERHADVRQSNLVGILRRPNAHRRREDEREEEEGAALSDGQSQRYEIRWIEIVNRRAKLIKEEEREEPCGAVEDESEPLPSPRRVDAGTA